MISDTNKQLAQWAMEYALKNGCRQTRVNLYSGSESTFALRDAKVDNLKQASENGMSIQLYVDGKYGSISTNRLDKKELGTFIRNGIEATRYLAKDEARGLPEAERYYQGGKPDLQLHDPKYAAINPDDKVALAKAVAEEALGKDPRIVSVNSSFSDYESSSYMLTSNGFEGESKSSRFGLSAGVSVKGEGEARPSDGWYGSALYFDRLAKEGYGKKALERVLGKIGQEKIKSGKYTMIVDPLNSSNLLSPMLRAMYGSSLQQKNSFLLDKLGEKVGNGKFTLIDNPHQPQTTGASYFDGEGVATEKRTIFDKGVLNTYFIDVYNAKKMGVAPTIGGPSILMMEYGPKDTEGLVAGTGHGILITGFNGGNCNSSTGDFSYGIEGFLIENGKRVKPISEMNITGNMLSLWGSLADVGNDPLDYRSWRIPSLVFEDVNFSGL